MTKFQAVLISGASSGIGKACAMHLASRGFFVIAGVRRAEDGKRLEAEAGGNLRSLPLDITDAASIAAARDKVAEVTGEAGLKALINNAGIGVGGPVEHVTPNDWRRQFEVNVVGHVAVTQAMLPLIRRHVAQNTKGSGRIVFIGSIAGRATLPILGPYSASKHAIAAVATALRQEVQAQGIYVCLLEPGAIQSEIWNKAEEYVETVGAEDPSRILYGQHIEAMIRQTRQASRSAIPASHVAVRVEECLTRSNPQTRRTVGKDAAVAAFFNWALPERWFYKVIARRLKIPQ